MKQSLYDIGSLPDDFMKVKYINTKNTYFDKNSYDNFARDMLKSTKPEAPFLESDLPRTSRLAANNILTMQEHGSRYTKTPMHSDLFLGDLTKDDRLTTTEPRVNKMQEQNSFRYNKYIKGKLQESAISEIEGVVGERRMNAQVRGGHYDTARRIGTILGESRDGMGFKANNVKATTGTHMDASLRSQKETPSEKITPVFGMDVVSNISNKVGIQWDIQPDNRFGISSISNLYRAKGEVDRSAEAVFRLGEQDMKFSKEMQSITPGKIMDQNFQMLKQAKKNSMAGVSLKKDSIKNKLINKIMIKSTNVDNFTGQTQHKQLTSKEAFDNTFMKNQNGNAQRMAQGIVEKLNGKETEEVHVGQVIPTYDTVATMYTQLKSHKDSINTEVTNTVSTFGVASKIIDRYSTKIEQKKHQNNYNGEASSYYKQAYMSKDDDKISNVRNENSKYGVLHEDETMINKPSEFTTTYADINKVDLDQDPSLDGAYMNRTGMSTIGITVQKIPIMDNNITPLNDLANMYRRR